MMSPARNSIFINYRRADSRFAVGRTCDCLSAAFGREAVVCDLDSIPVGEDFPDEIRTVLADCRVVPTLLREYFAEELRTRFPDAWRPGHRRLYEHLTTTTEHQPDTLDGLQPLYQAVAHGCLAGLHQRARDDVYDARILRGTGHDGFYALRKLGAIGADLGR